MPKEMSQSAGSQQALGGLRPAPAKAPAQKLKPRGDKLQRGVQGHNDLV